MNFCDALISLLSTQRESESILTKTPGFLTEGPSTQHSHSNLQHTVYNGHRPIHLYEKNAWPEKYFKEKGKPAMSVFLHDVHFGPNADPTANPPTCPLPFTPPTSPSRPTLLPIHT